MGFWTCALPWAACETLELALGLQLDTWLERHHGPRVRELARSGQGFGIVAGTGTGKTLAIRPIAEELPGGQTPLRVGVVNRGQGGGGRGARHGRLSR